MKITEIIAALPREVAAELLAKLDFVNIGLESTKEEVENDVIECIDQVKPLVMTLEPQEMNKVFKLLDQVPAAIISEL